ncbi:MAG: CPBP family intramembrane glutamic endopeptidase [Bdellovibrionota bacterium]
MALTLFAHSLPWVENLKVINAVRFSDNTLPFTMYLNFDKPFVAVIIFAIMGYGTANFHIVNVLKWSSITMISCIVTLIGLAFSIGYINYDPKLPSETIIWTLNNLFLVCTAEEAFFRRYLQNGISILLQKFNRSSQISILLTSILFGLAHIKGGLEYILISTVAGIFYGYAYNKTQRVEAAIIVHFGLNATHFFLFSYPALSPI